jgi:Rad3-related DNA helicase
VGILDYFPGEPRTVQREVLEQLEANWNSADVFVISAPVATGKSRIATTLAGWAGDAAVLTPTNVLVDQYASEFTTLAPMHRASRYRSKRDFLIARRKYLAAPVGLSNYYIYMTHKAYRPTVIFDEAHNVLPMLIDGVALKLWKHLYRWPDDIHDMSDLMEWIEHNDVTQPNRLKKIDELRTILEENRGSHLIEMTRETYRGRERELIQLKPLDARGGKPILWPGKVQKIVLMSATINQNDIYDMGLDDRRVCYIECNSPIPPVNRPFVYLGKCNMAYRHRQASVPIAAEAIQELLQKHPERGVIHCTYAVSRQLRRLLGSEERMLWTDKHNRNQVYQEFLDSPAEEGKVLVASSLYEGVDLNYDRARWQVLCQVPWMSLAEPAVRERLEQRPESYAWAAIRTILQGTGRVCRTPTDRGVTYMLDVGFKRLYNDNQELIPKWFKEAMR